MKCSKALLIVFALMTFAHHQLLADDVKIIANLSVKADTISAAELRRVFLEEKITLSDGTHVEPVLEKGGPSHKVFLEEYLGVSEDDLQTYYRTLLFTGKGSMPKELGSDVEVVDYVGRTRGAIGYVSGAASVEGVKLLAIGTPSTVERKLIVRIEPDYPETLKRLNIGGTVRLRISISAKGNVEDVELLGGNPILAETAIAAVRKWIYAAGRSPSVSEISISFGPH
jgi:TonB family protein